MTAIHILHYKKATTLVSVSVLSYRKSFLSNTKAFCAVGSFAELPGKMANLLGILSCSKANEHFITLNTGAKMPSIAIGTWHVPANVTQQQIETAVKAGYRHIDAAPIYGNQKEIGLALKNLFAEGVVKREDMFISSKLWHGDHLPENVRLAIDETLAELQLDYIDLWMIHWPIRIPRGNTAITPETVYQPVTLYTWQAMEAVYDTGKARAIAVSNFSTRKLADVLKYARIKPAVNQVEAHPVWRQDRLRKFCETHGVHLSAWGPLGSPGTDWIAATGTVLGQPIVIDVAKQLGKTPAQVALRWGLQMGYSVLPKSVHDNWIKENLEVFGWSIPHNLMHQLSQIEQKRLAEGSFCLSETGPYQTYDDLWDDDGY